MLARVFAVDGDDHEGSRDHLESFVKSSTISVNLGSPTTWEMVLPSDLETRFGASVTTSATSRKRRESSRKQVSSSGSSLKYLIRTPPRANVGTGSPSSSLGSSASLSLSHGFSSFEPPVPYQDLLCWPSLEDFLVTAPEWANCSICSELFDEPVEWPGCEHIFCKSCVTRILNYGHRECPLCRGMLPNDCGFDDLPHSTRMSSAMLLLPARCRWGLETTRKKPVTPLPELGSAPSSSSAAVSISHSNSFDPLSSSFGSPSSSSSTSNMDLYMRNSAQSLQWEPREDGRGCPEIVPLSSLPEHHATCPYAPVRCLFPGCRYVQLRMDIESHQLQCPHQPATCPNCSGRFSKTSLPSHLQQCPEARITCDCGESMLRKALAEHTRVSCANAELACLYQRHGCSYRGMRSSLDNHLIQCPYHAMRGYIEQTELRFSEYDRTIERLESMILSMRTQLHSQNTRNSSRSAHPSMGSYATLGLSSIGSRSSMSSSQHSSSNIIHPSVGPVGHGPRSGRYWDDDAAGGDSDDEFSLHL